MSAPALVYLEHLGDADSARIASWCADADNAALVLVHPWFFETDIELAAVLNLLRGTPEQRALVRPLDACIARTIQARSTSYCGALGRLLSLQIPTLGIIFEEEAHLAKTWGRLNRLVPSMQWTIVPTQARTSLPVSGSFERVLKQTHSCGARRLTIAGCYVSTVAEIPTDGCVSQVARAFKESPLFGDANVEVHAEAVLISSP